MQVRVRQQFESLKLDDEKSARVPWKFINAAQSMDQVESDIWKVVQETMKQVEEGKPLGKMWQDGEYSLDVKKENPTK